MFNLSSNGRTVRLKCIRFVWSSTIAVLAACGGGPVPGPADAGQGDAPECVPVPELIAQGLPCNDTTDCPCGAYCSGAQCVADCATDADCGEGVCDEWGRCAVGDGLPTEVRTSLVVYPHLIVEAEVEGGRPFHVVARGADAGETVIEGDPGLVFQCEDGGEWVERCEASSLTVGDDHLFRVRVEPSLMVEGFDPPFGVRVLSDRGVQTATVLPGAASTPEEGSYRYLGSATLLGNDDEELLQIPVALDVQVDDAGTGSLVLYDTTRVLNPEGQWAGAVDGMAVTFPRTAYRRASTSMAETEVLSAANATLEEIDESILLRVAVRYEGAHSESTDQYWRIAASKSEVPAEVIPRVLAPVEPTLEAEAAGRPSAWEQEFRRIIGEVVLSDAVPYGQPSLTSCVDGARNDALPTEWAPMGWWPVDGSDSRPFLGLFSDLLTSHARFRDGSFNHFLEVTNEVRTSSPPNEIPCALRIGATTTQFVDTDGCYGTGTSTQVGGRVLDSCDDFAAIYDCEPTNVAPRFIDVTSTVRTSRQPVADPSADLSCVQTGTIDLDAFITRTCVVRRPTVCSESVLCHDTESASSADERSEQVRSSHLDSAGTPLAVSGELPCADGPRSVGWEMDANLELEATDSERLSAAELLATCEQDFETARMGIPLIPENEPAVMLRTLFSSAGCFGPGRLMVALGAIAASDDELVDEASGALAHRLIQRWVQHVGFVSGELAQNLEYMVLFGEELGVEDALANLQSVWDTVLSQRIASLLLRIPPAILADPDYRDRLGQMEGQAHHTQDTGLPVSILSSLSAQLELVHRAMEIEWRRGGDATDAVGPVLRNSAVLLSLAEALLSQAGPAAVWADDYEIEREEFIQKAREVLALREEILAGGNIFGISEVDLPLYRLGNEEGPTGQYFAVSEYILGVNPGAATSGSNWAAEVTLQAREAVADARERWLDVRERQVQLAQSQGELDATLDEIRGDYGLAIANICAHPTLRASDLLENWNDFDPNTCYFTEEDGCGFDAREYEPSLTTNQMQFQLCLISELRARDGGATSFNNNTLDDIVDGLDDCELVYPLPCDGGRCVACGGAQESISLARIYGALYSGDPNSARLSDAEATCRRRFPDADESLPPTNGPVASGRSASCYQGELGEATLELLAVAEEVEIASADYADFQQRYDIAMAGCLLLEETNSAIAEANAAHRANVRGLRIAKQTIDQLANASSVVSTCASALGGAEGLGGAVVCGEAIYQGALTAASMGLEFAIEDASIQHDALIGRLGRELENATCFNEAKLELVGVESAAIRIRQAALELENAILRVGNLKGGVQDLFREGRRRLARARQQFVPPLTHDLWAEESLEGFRRTTRLASRAIYLGIRALEYETQQSYPDLRRQLFEAQNGNQLYAIMEQIWQESGTRTVRGRRVSDFKRVVSLRDDILRLGDVASRGPGFPTLSPQARLAEVLRDPRYARYSESGEYVGQFIPFELMPDTGASVDGNVTPVFPDADCAERLWSISASIETIGESGISSSFARIELHKANTFYSRMCGVRDGEDGLQVASVRPSRNLFRETGEAVRYGGENFGTSRGEDNLSSVARLDAYVNVGRSELESDEYASGASEELSARGLFGRYGLLLPVQLIDSVGADALDDILIRLDYLSVSNR